MREVRSPRPHGTRGQASRPSPWCAVQDIRSCFTPTSLASLRKVGCRCRARAVLCPNGDAQEHMGGGGARTLREGGLHGALAHEAPAGGRPELKRLLHLEHHGVVGREARAVA